MKSSSSPLRRAAFALLAVSLTGGCSALGLGGGGDEDVAPEPSAEQRRAACDRLAAQAIDTQDLLEARRLAARATECYAAEAARGG